MGANTVTAILTGKRQAIDSYVQETPRGGTVTSHVSSSSSWTEVVPVQARSMEGNRYKRNPPWLPQMLRQLETLVTLPRGWDGYDAAPMSIVSVQTFAEFLRDNDHYIRSSPLLSLTSEGGILARWSSSDSELDLYFEPGEPVEVVFETHIDSHEESGLATNFPQLAKWLWQSSAVS